MVATWSIRSRARVQARLSACPWQRLTQHLGRYAAVPERRDCVVADVAALDAKCVCQFVVDRDSSHKLIVHHRPQVRLRHERIGSLTRLGQPLSDERGEVLLSHHKVAADPPRKALALKFTEPVHEALAPSLRGKNELDSWRRNHSLPSSNAAVSNLLSLPNDRPRLQRHRRRPFLIPIVMRHRDSSETQRRSS